MKILQLTNKVPYPPLEGGSIAMNMITQGLIRAGCEVKILSMNTSKNYVDLEQLPKHYKESTGIEGVYVDNRVKPFDALVNLLFTKKSYHITRFITEDFKQKLIGVLQARQYDIVFLEMLYLAPYIDIIRKYSTAKIILRAHNIEHFIWERMTAGCKNPVKKFYLSTLTARLKKSELEYINRVDGIAAISMQDAQYLKNLGCRVPLIDIPVAVDSLPELHENENKEFPGFFHIGTMNWMPNIEGVRWLLENVWPLVLSQKPDARLTLAGRNFPEWFYQHDLKGVFIIGEVPDAASFMMSKQVMLVPLLSGSGMRVKIIEGMSLGKTIISTTIGAEGIACEHGRDIIIADSPGAFVNAMITCAENKTYCEKTGMNARSLIKTHYDNSIVTMKLVNFFNETISYDKS